MPVYQADPAQNTLTAGLCTSAECLQSSLTALDGFRRKGHREGELDERRERKGRGRHHLRNNRFAPCIIGELCSNLSLPVSQTTVILLILKCPEILNRPHTGFNRLAIRRMHAVIKFPHRYKLIFDVTELTDTSNTGSGQLYVQSSCV